MPELAPWVQIASVLGAVVALIGLFKGLIEYLRQTTLKRAEHFSQLRGRLKQNETFKVICDLLDRGDARLSEVTFKEKRDCLGLFEEVALALNSKLIRENVAFYMFGYYAIRCWEDENFWKDVNRESYYWNLFRDFAMRMQALERDILADPVQFDAKQYKF
jgi:hypothetical protein